MVTKSNNGLKSRSGPLSRLGQLRLSFAKLGVDALLVSHLPNIKYLCGFSGSAGFLLVDSSSSTLITDSRYTFQAREEVHESRVHIAKAGVLRATGEMLRARRGIRRLGFSGGYLTVAQKQALASHAGSRIRWVSDGGAVETQREVKDAGELSCMRDAANLISQVFSEW